MRIARHLGVFLCLLLSFEQTTFAVMNLSADLPVHHFTGVAERSPLPANYQTRQKEKAPIHKFSISPRTRLPVLSNGQVAIPSNADNFHNPWNASVDPRTGRASFSLTVDSSLYDGGLVKHDLVLSYEGSASMKGPDTFGIGAHWNWNVGAEHPSISEVGGHKTTDIITGDGHAFTMVSDRNATGQTVWHPLRHKLDDVAIMGRPGDWTVSMATGVREHIKNGYEDWEKNRAGQTLYFYYDRGSDHDKTRHLIYICGHELSPDLLSEKRNACDREGVWLTYLGNTVTVHGLRSLKVNEARSRGILQVKSVSMPSLSSVELRESRIQFSYDTHGNRPWLLRSVSYPDGMSTTFLYNSESDRSDARTQGLPVGLKGAHIPVVTELVTHNMQRSIPDRHVWYYYGAGNSNLHNYTGYQSGSALIPGQDNLLDRADNYTYSVTQDNGLTRTITIYNKYHLPLAVTQKSDRNQQIIGRNEKYYPNWKNTTFAQLPANYSLATESAEKLYAVKASDDGLELPLRIVNLARYNEKGQAIWRRDAYGRETFIQYCPAQGNDHCPAKDPDWPDINRPEKIVMIPARNSSSRGVSLTDREKTTKQTATEIVFDYHRLPAAHGNSEKTGGSHLWLISRKTVGSQNLSKLAGLKPGDVLPDLSDGKISTQTAYTYDINNKSPFYGQLTHIEVIRHRSFSPESVGHLINFSLSALSPLTEEKIGIDIAHHIDPYRGTRTLILSVNPEPPLQGNRKFMVDTSAVSNSEASLGTSVYSLRTGLKIAASDTMKTMEVHWTYDIWNRPVQKVITPFHGGKSHVITWDYIVHSGEMAVVQTGVMGNQKKTVLADDGKVLSTWHRFSDQATRPMAGSSNWIPDSSIVYTRTGKPASETIWHAGDRSKSHSGKAIALTTTFGYDSLNRNTWEKSPDGVINVIARDDPAMQVIHYRVASGVSGASEEIGSALHVVKSNILGKPEAVYVLPLSPFAKKKGKPVYPPSLQKLLKFLRERLESVKTLDTLNSYGLLPLEGHDGLFEFVRSAIAAGAWLTRTTFEYDGSGRRIQQTMGNGATTQWKWKNGNLVAVIAPDGRIIHDEFNVQGEKVSRCVQPSGIGLCHLLGKREYDNQGNLLWQSDEAGNLIRYTYDGDGRELSMITADGHVLNRHYGSLGPVEVDVDGVPAVLYRYDPVSWKLTDREDRISHVHYQYDKHTGFPVKVERSRPQVLRPLPGLHYPEGTESFEWDRYGQPVSETDMAGNLHEAVHDSMGRVIRRQVWLSGAKKVTRLVTYTRDLFGRPVSDLYGNGVLKTFHYNLLGQIDAVTHSRNHQPFLTLGYTYDPDTGNILKKVRKEANLAAIQTFHYDITGNLEDMSCNALGKPDTASELCPRDNDLDGSGLASSPVILSQHYDFDHWNNIRKVTEKLSSQEKGHARLTHTVSYIYAWKKRDDMASEAYDPHRMVAFDSQWSDQEYSASPHVLVYDKVGRIIRDGNGNTLHYNALGQQDRFIRADNGTITRYGYDSEGHQVVEQSFDSRNHPVQSPLYMLYSGNTIVEQVQKDIQGKNHVSVELAGVAHGEDGKITSWYLHDYKGDVISTLDSRGVQIKDNVYSPYGMRYDRLQPVKHLLPLWQSHCPGFDGEMEDSETGYQFLGGGYRAYNPVYRHFMSQDSYSPFRKIDGYGFGDNNPVMNTDPTGHLPKWFGYLMGGVGIAMATVISGLLPVTAAVIAPAVGLPTALVGGVTAVSMAFGAMGVASGSLQIASTAHLSNRRLSIAAQSFGLAAGLVEMVTGPVDILSGIANMINGVAKVTFYMILGSSAATFLSGLGNTIGMSMGMALTVDPGNAHRAGFLKAMNVINGISMGLMSVSLLAGTFSLAGIGVKQIKRWRDSNVMNSMRESITKSSREEEKVTESASGAVPRKKSSFERGKSIERQVSYSRADFKKPELSGGRTVLYSLDKQRLILYISPYDSNIKMIREFEVKDNFIDFAYEVISYMRNTEKHGLTEDQWYDVRPKLAHAAEFAVMSEKKL